MHNQSVFPYNLMSIYSRSKAAFYTIFKNWQKYVPLNLTQAAWGPR